MITRVIETFAICRLCHIGHFLKKVVARLTEHDDVVKHCSEGPAPKSCIGLRPCQGGCLVAKEPEKCITARNYASQKKILAIL